MRDKLNGLGRLIDKSRGRLAEDPSAKRLFSNKQVLGRFAKACLPEYHDFPLKTVIRECFDDDISLQGGKGSPPFTEFARSIGTEQILPQNDTLHLDLLFNAWVPCPVMGRRRKLINIEIQNDAQNLERLIGRGIVYNSSIVCSEYGTVFRYPHYEMIEGVNAIWICPAAPSEWAGSTLCFNLNKAVSSREERLVLSKDVYDKFRLFFIGANLETGVDKRDIHGLVWTLTTQSLTAAERKKILTEVYEMDMTEALEKSVDESEEWLYNYYGKERINQIKAEGREEGRRKGREEGRRKGREEGRRKGREEEKQKNVLHLLKMRYSIKRIKAILQLTEDEILRIARDNNAIIP